MQEQLLKSRAELNVVARAEAGTEFALLGDGDETQPFFHQGAAGRAAWLCGAVQIRENALGQVFPAVVVLLCVDVEYGHVLFPSILITATWGAFQERGAVDRTRLGH